MDVLDEIAALVCIGSHSPADRADDDIGMKIVRMLDFIMDARCNLPVRQAIYSPVDPVQTIPFESFPEQSYVNRMGMHQHRDVVPGLEMLDGERKVGALVQRESVGPIPACSEQRR